MYSRLKLIALMSVSLIISLSLPVYGDSRRLLTQNPSLLAQTTAETDKLFEQGIKLYRRGQYFKAVEVYQRVLKIRRQQQDKAGIAQTLNNLGEVYIRLDENDKADKALQEALVIRRELKDRIGVGETLNNIGYIYFGKEQYNKAFELLQQALAIHRQVNNRKGEAKTLANIGIVYTFGLNKDAEAAKFFQQAIRIHEEVGDKYEAGFTLYNLAQTYALLNQFSRAFEVLEKAKLVNS